MRIVSGGESRYRLEIPSQPLSPNPDEGNRAEKRAETTTYFREGIGSLDFIQRPPAEESERAVSLTSRDLSPDQSRVYQQILKWVHKKSSDVLTLGGYAGTGKTTLVSLLAREIQDDFTIGFCAYTGKASGVLRNKLRASAVDIGERHSCGTIHRLIYKPRADERTGRIIDWGRQEELLAKDKKIDLIILDEASMVGPQIFADLLEYEVPILAVGDHGQLPPVAKSGGRNFNLMTKPKMRLEKIHRQALGNPIIALSAAVRAGKSLTRFKTDDPRVSMHLGEVPQRTKNTILEAAFADRGCPDHTVFLCGRNKSRQQMNDWIRLRLGFEKQIEPEDTVICLRNALFGPALVANGMRGRIQGASTDKKHWYKAIIDHEDDGFRVTAKVLKSQFGQPKTLSEYSHLPFKPRSWDEVGMLYDYGYAMTVHKFQGSQARNVIVRVERNSRQTDEDYKRWLYTAVTRASENLTLFASKKDFPR